jgi:hypothetical protein
MQKSGSNSFLPPEFIKYFENSKIPLDTLETAYKYQYKSPIKVPKSFIANKPPRS